MPFVEACTALIKQFFLRDEAVQTNYITLLKDGGDVVDFQLNLVNQVCPTAEANATSHFIRTNSDVIAKLAAFTRTLPATDVAAFENLQKTAQFAKMLAFMKLQYDRANATEKEELKQLMQSILPQLFQKFNASETVTNYFNALTPDALINIVERTESHNVTALKQTVIGTFNSLNMTLSQREEIERFIDSIHTVKNSAFLRLQ